MSMLDMLEGMLNLNDQEKATVAAAAPTIDKWVVLLNQQWDTLSNAVGWLTSSRPVADRIIADGRILGPIAHDVLSGGGSVFEMGSAMSAAKDAENVVNSNPKLVQALKMDWAKLAPLVAQVQHDAAKPEVKAAIQLIQTKMGENNITHGRMLTALVEEAGKSKGHSGRGSMAADVQVIKGGKQ